LLFQDLLQNRNRLTKNAIQIGRVAIILLILIPGTKSTIEDIESIVAKRVALDQIVSRNRWTTQRLAGDSHEWAATRVVDRADARGFGVICLPPLDEIVLNPGTNGAIQHNAAGAAWSAIWVSVNQLVTQSNVFDSWIEESPIAGVADFVLFELCAVCLDTVVL
jgi:hypothetical protein